jgi:hypothetical protein
MECRAQSEHNQSTIKEPTAQQDLPHVPNYIQYVDSDLSDISAQASKSLDLLNQFSQD